MASSKNARNKKTSGKKAGPQAGGKVEGAGRKSGGTHRSGNGPTRKGTKRGVTREETLPAAKRQSSARKSQNKR